MTDINSMLIAFGGSLYPLQRMVTGFSYVLGIYLFMKSIEQLRQFSSKHGTSPGKGTFFVPLMYFFGAASLLFLPTMIDIATNTLFGYNSPLEYSSWFNDLLQAYGNATYVITIMIQTLGIVWFIRGCFLLVKSSEPGVQHAARGLAFLVGGILAINFLYTANMVSGSVNYFVTSLHALYPVTEKNTIPAS